jgi:hypothetical protein
MPVRELRKTRIAAIRALGYTFGIRAGHCSVSESPFWDIILNMIHALKQTGEVAVIDFYKREAPIGPPLSMKLSEEEVTKDFLKAGFTLNKQLSFLPYQYFLIFRPKRGG